MKIKKQKTKKIKNEKFENYKNCLGAIQLDNKINYLEKNQIDIDSFKKDHTESVKNNKLILNTQQTFKNERHNVFTEEVNKIALTTNDDRRMESFDSIETCAYGMSKDLVSEKEEIKCNNIIKRYKKWLTLMMLQKKT